MLHLWSRHQHKLIKLGTLRWLPQQVPHHARSLRLSDLPLLLLRLALVVLAAMLLARPWLLTQPQAPGWVLVSPEAGWVAQPRAFYRWLDSLKAKRWELRSLQEGYPPFSLEDGKPANTATSAAWQLVAMADRQLAKGLGLEVVVTRAQQAYLGKRPGVSSRVHWHTLPQEAGPTQQLAAAWHLQDSVVVAYWLADSSTASLQFALVKAQPGMVTVGQASYQLKGSPLRISGADTTLPVLSPPTHTVVITCTPATLHQAQVLQLAFKALGVRKGMPVQAKVELGELRPDSAQLWCWLRADSLPGWLVRQLQQGASVLCLPTAYKPIPNTVLAATTPWAGNARVVGAAPLLPAPGVPIWHTGTGQNLLLRQQMGKGWRYLSFIPLSPQATDAPLQGSFPYLLAGLLTHPPLLAPRGLLLPARLTKPALLAKQPMAAPAVEGVGGLHLILWLLLVGLVAAERYLSTSR